MVLEWVIIRYILYHICLLKYCTNILTGMLKHWMSSIETEEHKNQGNRRRPTGLRILLWLCTVWSVGVVVYLSEVSGRACIVNYCMYCLYNVVVCFFVISKYYTVLENDLRLLSWCSFVYYICVMMFEWRQNIVRMPSNVCVRVCMWCENVAQKHSSEAHHCLALYLPLEHAKKLPGKELE